MTVDVRVIDVTIIDVTIIGGYLGAGKTSLVNHLLPHLDGRTVVLVNDFGALGIDGDLIAATDSDTITLANGCICCSMVDGLSAAIDSIASMTPRPERLLIETSGVAEPGSVAAYTHVPGFRLDGVVVVVDAETIRSRADDRFVGDTVRRQVEQADIVILNKADLLSATALVDCRSWLEEFGGRPLTIIAARHARVHPDTCVGLDLTRSLHTDRPPAAAKAPDFHTASFVADGLVDHHTLAAWVSGLPTHVVRVKGIVQTTDQAHLVVQRVGTRVSWAPVATWPGGPSRIVLISAGAPCDDEIPLGFRTVT